MEAKDTVIPTLDHSESIWCPHCGEEFGIELNIALHREEQAEITWGKAEEHFGQQNAIVFSSGVQTGRIQGKQAGIREVVEWMEANSVHKDGLSHYCPNCDHTILGVNPYQWQAKLKEWGIE